MPTSMVEDLIQRLFEYRLLNERQQRELSSNSGQYPDSQALISDLIERGWLTKFQAKRILSNNIDSLTIGNYLILEQLGEGGMGLVYKCRHRMMGRIAVLKIIRKEYQESGRIPQRFKREIEATASLNHPNIVTVFEAGEADKTQYLVMELIDGTDLGRLVLDMARNNQRLEEKDACDYIRQAALALQCLYDNHLIHRDIKPDNMMLTKNGVVKLLDLGLCRPKDPPGTNYTDAITRAGASLGTPEYMAPEQIRDARSVDIRADIYSLGCTLYYLLSGRDAFAGGAPAEVMRRQAREQPPDILKYRPSLHPGIQKVMLKMMAKKPEDRYQTPQEVANALAPFCAPPSTKTPTDLSQPATISGKLPEGFWIWIVGAFLMCVAMLAALIVTLVFWL